MLPPMDEWPAQMNEGLAEMGMAATEPQLCALLRHLELVSDANASFNLTAIPAEQYVPLHVLDSIAVLPYLNAAPPGEFADLGSGAGFPGVPLAILTGRRVVLVESVKKKAAFLERVVTDLCLEASVQGIRAEELALERRAAFAAVTARALSSLPSLVELASPLLLTAGLLICLKGALEGPELARGDSAARSCGMERVTTASLTVPHVDAQRAVVVYRRCAAEGVALPRRSGMAQRRPLA
jgi:16S rRNA (guanine527-N7)-methyltransferase